MEQHLIVWTGLVGAKKDIKDIQDFFNKQGWATRVRYIMEWKTLPGQGGSGGRNDTLLEISGAPKEIGKFSVERFNMGSDTPRWLGDYISNNRSIIPPDVLFLLEKDYSGRDYVTNGESAEMDDEESFRQQQNAWAEQDDREDMGR